MVHFTKQPALTFPGQSGTTTIATKPNSTMIWDDLLLGAAWPITRSVHVPINRHVAFGMTCQPPLAIALTLNVQADDGRWLQVSDCECRRRLYGFSIPTARVMPIL